MYGSSGICRVTDIRKEKMGGIEREYYILKPAYDENSKVYVPVDSENLHKKIKNVLSPEEIYELIKMIKSIHKRSEQLSESGRKLGNADRTAMKRAEKLLHEEFAMVLNIGYSVYMKQIEPGEK